MKTAYVVLKLDETAERGPRWIEGPTVDAASADAAIRASIDGGGSATGTFVAVPARSWNPASVTTETKTVVKIAEATL